MTCGIYLITNKKTRQKYIGQSINIEKRWTQHCNGRNDKNIYIDDSIAKYGKANFKLTILEEVPQERLSEREEYWIAKYDTFENRRHYNLTPGGEALFGDSNPFYGKTHSMESRKKMSEFHKGKKLSEETKQKISKVTKGENNPRYGKPVSAETREKISEENSGRQFTLEDKLNMSYSKNSTGFFRVHKQNDNHCKKGFMYSYTYVEDGRQKPIVSVKIDELEKKVKSRGLPWKIIDEKKAIETIKESEEEWVIFKKNQNKTGYYRVSIIKSTQVKQGFYYQYSYTEEGQRKFIKSIDIMELEEKVKSRGLPWIVMDHEKARLTNEKSDANRTPTNKTGFYRVNKNKSKTNKQGFIWRYQYKEGDKYKTINRSNLTELYEEVLKKGLPWRITDYDLALMNIKENKKYFNNSN